MIIRDSGYITLLVIRDICFEWLLSACMICSLGAIFAPMFILLGLQQGIIGNMLDTLKSDPLSRLVTPKFAVSSPLEPQHLQEIKEHSTALITSPVSHLLLDIEGLEDSVNIIPTTIDDPLLLVSSITLDDKMKDVVLSHNLAKKLNKTKNDFIRINLVRFAPNREQIPIELEVAGVLPDELSSDEKAWIDADLFTLIYQWRKGWAVPDLGLTGTGADTIEPEYDGVLTIFESRIPTDEEYRLMLSSKIAFSTPPVLYEDTGWDDSLLHQKKFLWTLVNNTINSSDIELLINRHHNFGYSLEAIPFLDDFVVEIHSDKSSKRSRVTILPDELSASGDPGFLPTVFVPQKDFAEKMEGELMFTAGFDKKKVVIPVMFVPSKNVNFGFVAVPSRLAGLMRAAQKQGAFYDTKIKRFFIPANNSIRYFRAYAPSIDGLEELVHIVSQKGLELGSRALQSPVSRLSDVKRIRTLSGYMEKIYVLIAVISGISTVFAVAASVYAGVQRKRYDLAYLGMLGLPRKIIFLFPLIKSLLLIVGGVVLAFTAYFAFGYLSSQWFVSLLGHTDSLTRLTPGYCMLLVSVIVGLGGITSFFAALSVMRVDSGKYIHE